jgi:hypothetical protein
MSSPLAELLVTVNLKPAAFEFELRTADLSKKPAYVEIVAAASENKGLAPQILSSRKKVEAKEGDALGKFKIDEIIELDETFGFKLAAGYCIKIAAYDESRSKLAESSKFLATLAEAPEAPVLAAVKYVEVGHVALSLRLGKWSGARITSARVFLFKDVERATDDDIRIIEIPISVDKHVAGAAFSLDLESLDNETDYFAKVALENEIGLGSFSDAFSFRPADVPDRPLLAALAHSHEDNKLKIQWKAGEDVLQYGDDLKFNLSVLVSPFDDSSEEISFASAQVVPLKRVKEIVDEITVFETDKVKFNEYEVSLTSDSLAALVAAYPEHKVSRKLKFRAEIFSSDGTNSSAAAKTNEVTVVRANASSVALYEENVVISASGSQTRNADKVDKEVNVEVKLKAGVKVADIRKLLTDPPLIKNGPSSPWATKIEYKVSLVQTLLVEGDSKVDGTNAIDLSSEPSVLRNKLSTDVAFAKSNKLSIIYWLSDALGNKSQSFLYSKEVKIPVAALVYRATEDFTVNRGEVSTEVYAFPGTETDTLAASILSRAFYRYPASDRDPFQETNLLALLALSTPNLYKISFKPTFSGNNLSETVALRLKVIESRGGVLSTVFADQADIKTVVSNTDLSPISGAIEVTPFDAVISPSLPSSYKVLVSVPKSNIVEKLQIFNNETLPYEVALKVTASGKVLTIADSEKSENEIKIALSSSKLESIEVASSLDSSFKQELAILNKSSLIDTHIFVYLKITSLAPSVLAITSKVSRVIDEQEYSDSRVISAKLNDDFGYVGDYEFSDNALAIRINRNGNVEEDGFLSIWGLAEGSGTSDGPLKVSAVLNQSAFIKRNQVEDWALIDLVPSGAQAPFVIEALMVVMTTGARSTSSTFRILLQTPGDGKKLIIEDLIAKKALLE